LIAACDAAYEKVRTAREGEGAKVIPPARYRGWLAGAAHSHEELEKLLKHLEKVLGELKAEEA
jgi:glutamate-1-semialdehyde aminotransferase